MNALVHAPSAPVPSAPALSVRDLTVRYGRAGKTLPAVDGVSFDVAPGETLGLVGESGSGKSTIGKAILGLQPPNTGRILLHGTDITRASLRQRRVTAIDLRVVFQDPYSSLNPAQTIGQTLTEPLQVLRVPKDRRRPRILESLAAVGLPADAADRYPARFSGGQRQRIAIARALVCDPQVIVLDEPVSALDLSTQAQVLNLLADLRDSRQLALLFIAHDLGVVRFLAQRVVVLYRGQVMEAGGAEEVTQRPRHPYSIALTAAAPVPQPAEQARRRAARGGRLPVRHPLPARHRRLPPRASAAGLGSRLSPRRPGGRAPVADESGLRPFRIKRRFSCSSSPTASCGGSPAPATRTRAATSTATPGSPSTCGRPSSASRQARRATAGNCGTRTSTWRRG
jgi:ABC-type oligopeptide transport system ATPase subunit